LVNSQQRQAGYRLLRSGLEALEPHTLAGRLARGWDRYGAPSAARTPEGEGYIASFEGPGDPVTVKAETKREAYRTARRLWVKRFLEGGAK
jgi:hypothetical protein